MNDLNRNDGVSALVIAASAAPILLTGTLTETNLVALKIPGKRLGPQGMLRLTAFWSLTNNANSKTARIRLGPSTNIGSYNMVSMAAASILAQVFARGEAAQIANQSIQAPFSGGASIGAIAVDMTVDQDLIISGQLGNVGDSMTLEAWIVELLNGNPQ